jgi:hypothetical protein
LVAGIRRATSRTTSSAIPAAVRSEAPTSGQWWFPTTVANPDAETPAAAAASCRSASSCSRAASSMMADPVLLRLAAITPSIRIICHLRAAASSKKPTSLIFQIFSFTVIQL